MGITITNDPEGRKHSFDGKPAHADPYNGLTIWKDHGRYHRECGKDWFDSLSFQDYSWSLNDDDLMGRILLWK